MLAAMQDGPKVRPGGASAMVPCQVRCRLPRHGVQFQPCFTTAHGWRHPAGLFDVVLDQGLVAQAATFSQLAAAYPIRRATVQRMKASIHNCQEKLMRG